MAFSFLGDLWEAFKSIFQSAEKKIKKLYDALSQPDKDALVNGSGFMAVVNTMLDAAPEAVENALQQHFPSVNIKELEANAYSIVKSLGLSSDGSFRDSIAKLQTFLKGLPEGGIWAGISTGLSFALALLLGGAQEKAEVFIKVLGYVYKYIVRPKVMQTDVPKIGTLIAKNSAVA